MSYATITTTITGGYNIASGVTGLSITSTGKVGGTGVTAAAYLDVFNDGSIVGARVWEYGLNLEAGGKVTNSAGAVISGNQGIAVAAGGLHLFNYGDISAVYTAVEVHKGVSNVDNRGTISGTHGVFLATGDIANYGTILGGAQVFYAGGEIINGSSQAPNATIMGQYAAASGNGTILNDGTLIGTTLGVELGASGGESFFRNGAASARVEGGVLIQSHGTVINFGSISGGGHAAVYLEGGGQVTSGTLADTTALIEGAEGVATNTLPSATTTLANFGTIIGDVGVGVSFSAGGEVTNGSVTDRQARIVGYSGVTIAGSGGLANYGAIVGELAATGDAGVSLGSGSVTNGGGPDTSALISGEYGVWVRTGAGGVVNFGTIEGEGGPKTASVFLQAGGYVVNGGASDTSARIDGGSGVAAYASATVSNFGTIVSTANQASAFGGFGVLLTAGGAVTNGSGTDRTATIAGYEAGVAVRGGAGAIKNFATISGTGGTGEVGVDLEAGGSLTNGTASDTAALIEGYSGLVLKGGSATNFGVILGQGATGTQGAAISASARLTNRASGVVEGYTGVLVQSGASLINFGTVVGFGGTAVSLSGATSLLAVESGCSFNGAIVGGGGVLDLASGAWTHLGLLSATGAITLSGPIAATSFTGFGSLEVGAGASFTDTSSGVIATSQTLIVAGTLTVNGAVTGAGTVRITTGTADFLSTFTQAVTFAAGSTGVLALAKSQTYSGTITGFSKTGANALDLADIAFGTGTKATYMGTATSGTLTVTDGTHTAKIKLAGDYTASTFTLSSDGAGGTKVVDPPAPAIAAPPSPHGPAPLLPFLQAAAGLCGGAAGSSASDGPISADAWRDGTPRLMGPDAFARRGGFG